MQASTRARCHAEAGLCDSASLLLHSVHAGASVIYADTVADLGYADELGNYAEYSGAPNQQVIKQRF